MRLNPQYIYLYYYYYYYSLISTTVLILLGGIASYPDPAPINVALGAKCAFDPPPNYKFCTDNEDSIQLTDGKYARGQFWTNKLAVGWANVDAVIITLDLGKTYPICGVSFNTAAGTSDVKFPSAIHILVANNDDTFHYLCDLVKIDKNPPQNTRYSVHRYYTNKLRSAARKVAFVVQGEPYIFCDEIEIWKGKNSFLKLKPTGKTYTDLKSFLRQIKIHKGVSERLTKDINKLSEITAQTNLLRSKEIKKKLNTLRKELKSIEPDYPENFKTIIPLTDLHEQIFHCLGSIWQEKGIHDTIIWAENPWRYVNLICDKPGNDDPSKSLHLEMMQNEVRSVAFNLASPKNKIETISISTTNEIFQNNIKLRKVLWTDTREHEPVADALIDLPREKSKYKVELTGGLVQQIWLTVNSKDIPPGKYSLQIKVGSKTLPFTLIVHPIYFPERPTLHMGGWDYTDDIGRYQVTKQNRTALVEMLKEYFVDSPWGTSAVLPFGDYDNTGKMTNPPDTSKFDAWRNLWTGARRFCVFLNVREKIKNFEMGTPEFYTAVGEWAKFWDNYMQKCGLEPSQLLLLLVDEPHETNSDKIIAEWGKAIHASGAKILVWEDPIYHDMSKALPEMIDQCDVLCPNRQIFYSAGENYRNFFSEQKKKGKLLEFYSCSGPMRLLDPTEYCRLQAWDCWRYGATAMHFWAFADGGEHFSWNEYLCKRTAYSPLFIAEDSVTPSKHIEAMREGIEDYEYLQMLTEKIATLPENEQTIAKSKLNDIVNEVFSLIPTSGILRWNNSNLGKIVDDARTKILQLLAEVSKK